MKKLTEHEAWVEIACALSTMRTMSARAGPGPTQFQSPGLCSVIQDLKDLSLISSITCSKMLGTLEANRPRHTRNNVYFWTPFKWEPRVRFAQRMANLTEPR